jgi:hypothetical protein
MDHFAATGVSGLDLYVRQNGCWRWLGVGRPRAFPTNCTLSVKGIPDGMHVYLLYLPLYNGVESVDIGIPRGATLTKGPPRPAERAKPICFYGTSITQGGCASRPGMAYPAILSRRLDCPVINLGFSGNGWMEPEVSALLAELDVAAYVLDALPNMSAEMIAERVQPFVETLWTARPDTPIVLVESILYQNGTFLARPRQICLEKNRALRAAYERLVAGQVTNLHYVSGDELYGEDGEATVDGTHATDLGFVRFAHVLEPVLRRVLGLH